MKLINKIHSCINTPSEVNTCISNIHVYIYVIVPHEPIHMKGHARKLLILKYSAELELNENQLA